MDNLMMYLISEIFGVVMLGLVAWAVSYVVPLVKTLMENERFKALNSMAEMLIRQAEETQQGESGKGKHDWVVNQLARKARDYGWSVKDEDIKAVTHAVYNTIKANIKPQVVD